MGFTVCVLAIDQGTSATKACVINDDGEITSMAEVAVRPAYGPHGSVEHEPKRLLESVIDAGRLALAQSNVRPDVLAFANQGETVLAWDRTSGQPLTTALVWQDSRAQGVCDAMAHHATDIQQKTGLALDPYFSAPKQRWIRDHLTRDGVVTTTDSWILHQLVPGSFVTDVTTASRSLVMNLDTREWDDDLLQRFGMQEENLPEIVNCDAVIGETSVFGSPMTVSGLIVDQQAALIAQRCFTRGAAKCTVGTGAFLLVNMGAVADRSLHGLSTSVAWQTAHDSSYCLDGQVYTAASAMRWLVDTGLMSSSAAIDAEVAPASDGVVCVPAFAGLGAPHWQSMARAELLGLSLDSTKGQIIRAVIEGIAAQVAELIGAVTADMGGGVSSLRVDGGLTNSSTVMQTLADLLQVPIEVYPSAHATPLGAAALARLGVGWVSELEQAAWPWRPSRVFEPAWTSDQAATFRAQWQDAVNICATRGGASGEHGF